MPRNYKKSIDRAVTRSYSKSMDIEFDPVRAISLRRAHAKEFNRRVAPA